jgi:hypothetical protein
MSTLQKAEVSTEFMVFIGILLVFFVFFTGIIGVNNIDIDESTVFANARNILDIVTNEINTASRIEGYYREFYIPEKLVSGDEYNITIYTSLRMVKIEWNGMKNIMNNIQTENIQGNVTPGINKIQRENGIVKINES